MILQLVYRQKLLLKLSRNLSNTLRCRFKNNDNLEDIDEEYNNIVKKCFLGQNQNVFIIHPYIKWGPKKLKEVSPNTQLSEAVSLVSTLNGWKVAGKIVVPVENLDKKGIFGKGTMDKLKSTIRADKTITGVFINLGVLRNRQVLELEQQFGKTILDRYKIVMHILKEHATGKHSKLQVALAEIPYLRSKLKYIESSSTNWETRDKMLQERHQKLKSDLKKLRDQRQLLRSKRTDLDFPIVAVVGYTNAGKTSLIKALTGDQTLLPKDQLFATLDVTLHAGFLPSNLEVLYVDTVGFITDIPTDLIECFIATLEDAILADVILHVQDVSNESMDHQKKIVNSVLENLANKTRTENLFEKVVCVGNKSDVLKTKEKVSNELILVSALNGTGIDQLKQAIEATVLRVTDRHVVDARVPIGGEEMRWLFKHATVVQQNCDETNVEYSILKVIITQGKLKQFKAYFCSVNNK